MPTGGIPVSLGRGGCQVEDLDAKDVAYVLKISPARVSQIHAKSIEKIKLMIK